MAYSKIKSNENEYNHWLIEDCPQSKLAAKGPDHLTDSEILAMIIGNKNMTNAVQIARDILNHVNGDLLKLSQLSISDLMKIDNIGQARAHRIFAAMELGRRRIASPAEPITKINVSRDVYDYIKRDLLDAQYESFWILSLRRNNTIIKKSLISIGGISGTLADPKKVFIEALENRASAIILVHNHPSGNLKPSEADIQMTSKIKNAGATLEMAILDHIIFTNSGYFSFSDEGIL